MDCQAEVTAPTEGWSLGTARKWRSLAGEELGLLGKVPRRLMCKVGITGQE